MKTLVEINNKTGAFCFKTFKGKNSLKDASRFCKELEAKSDTLYAFVRKTS